MNRELELSKISMKPFVIFFPSFRKIGKNGKMHHHNIGYTRKVNNKKFKKFEYRKNNTYYVIEEDLVGWYLIVYKNIHESSEDYLLDTLEDAMLEAEERFSIPKNSWKEL